VVNAVSLVPDFRRDPVNTFVVLLRSLTDKTASTGGLAGELQKSPVDSILVRGTIGGGRVELQQAAVQSDAFKADARGVITLAMPMTNSTIQVPVALELKRSLAQQIDLVPPNTPTNAAYAKLPDFLLLTGTVGKPQADKLTALTGIGSAIPGVGGIVKEVGGLFTRQSSGTTNAATASGTNSAGGKAGGLFQSLGALVRESTAGANAQTNQPATNQSPVNSLLDGFLGPKKK